MRLIDADELRKRMYHDAFETDSDMQKWDSGCWIRYKMFEHAIEEAPPIEVEPVRRGRWIAIKEKAPWLVCSECGTYLYNEQQSVAKYCYNCGAKMEGEE